MKTLPLVAAGAMGAMILSGCATHETTTTTTTNANPASRTYNKSQLNQTGRPDTAGAIEAADPSVQIH
jgi:pyrroline-5-carboxylate reductase